MKESISQKSKKEEEIYADLADELIRFDKIKREFSPTEEERRGEIIRQLKVIRFS